MANWQENTVMYWDGNKISDHGRGEVSVSFERIGNDTRTASGLKRRQQVALKRTFETSWENLPSKTVTGAVKTVDGGWNGDQMEDFVQSPAGSGPFRLILRSGSASGLTPPTVLDSALPYEDDNFEIILVMVTDFSKIITKRGIKTDLWNLSVTLEEV